MKKVILCFALFMGVFVLQQTAFAKNFSEGYFYSKDTQLFMTAYKNPPDADNDNWTLSVSIQNKDNKEVCTTIPEFGYQNSNHATGGGYTFTANELSPALIISQDEFSTEAELVCGSDIIGIYANLCPSAQSDLKQMTIKILDVYETEESVLNRIHYTKVVSRGYPEKGTYASIPNGSLEFFKALKDKTVNVRYKLEQVFNEHDYACVQEMVFYMVDGVSLQN